MDITRKRPTNAFGRCVKARLTEVFRTRQRFYSLPSKIRNFKAWLASRHMKAGGEDFPILVMYALLDKIQSLCDLHMPHSECDCGPEQYECEHCGGRRWMSMKQYMDRMDKEQERREIEQMYQQLERSLGVPQSNTFPKDKQRTRKGSSRARAGLSTFVPLETQLSGSQKRKKKRSSRSKAGSNHTDGERPTDVEGNEFAL